MERPNAWKSYNDEQLVDLEKLCDDYRNFLDQGKTERECVKVAIKMAEEAGYRNLKDIIKNNESLTSGDKVYTEIMGKCLAMFNIGSKSLEEGMNILGAHIDSPRLDVKQNPLYEDSDFAYLDTHYYGGVKKYQWVATPLAIHGVVVKKDGTVIDVVIGEDNDDPVVAVSDLLIHLSGNQMDKKASVVIEGEQLDVIVGSKPVAGEEKEAVKAQILGILKNKYDFEEEDFLSAELEVVPAGKARNAGIDSSMIMAYGQDDRVCAFTSLVAMLNVKNVEKTSCCLLVDKEEVGSVGATGMESRFFENSVAEVMDRVGDYSELKLRHCLANSCMLSSDVNAGYDPMFAEVYEKKNASFLGRGMVFSKFTGSGGKGYSNDANAEYIAYLREIMERENIHYQFAELGKVDVGGGGTIAYILALYGMNVIDCGVAVLNMHAPYEITSKADIYETECGYEVFLKNA
ncbi:MAG: aminopeptidase [Intestinibacter sp.]|uniref:aminopeptidase n=1 Tax=Intestinibacter sp. TaxID=1965304 RepID=UPI003F169C10